MSCPPHYLVGALLPIDFAQLSILFPSELPIVLACPLSTVMRAPSMTTMTAARTTHSIVSIPFSSAYHRSHLTFIWMTKSRQQMPRAEVLLINALTSFRERIQIIWDDAHLPKNSASIGARLSTSLSVTMAKNRHMTEGAISTVVTSEILGDACAPASFAS